MKLKWAKGFASYRWRRDYNSKIRRDAQQYEHMEFDIKIYIEDEVVNSGMYKGSYKIICWLYGEGKPFVGYVSGKRDLEISMEEIFKQLINIDGNLKVLFDGIFKK